MHKFKKVSGHIGENNYSIYHSHSINVNTMSDQDIFTLETMEYNKSFGYVNNGCWMNALIKKDTIDLKEKKKMEEKGYILEKTMIRHSHIPINKCVWIDDIIDDCIKKIVFKLPYDRYSKLDCQIKILEQDTFITYRDVLQFIDSFYNDYFTMEELEKVKDTNDCFNYSDLAKEAYKNKTKLKRKDVMGDCTWFEGFIEEDSVYILRLGS